MTKLDDALDEIRKRAAPTAGEVKKLSEALGCGVVQARVIIKAASQADIPSLLRLVDKLRNQRNYRLSMASYGLKQIDFEDQAALDAMKGDK